LHGRNKVAFLFYFILFFIPGETKMLGPKKCPEWLKRAYKRAVGFTCEDCRKVFMEKELEIHRIIAGYKGGTYRPGNVKVLCKDCHKNYAEPW